MLLRNKYSSCCSCAKCKCGTTLPATVTLDIQGRYGPKQKTYLLDVSVKSTFGCGAVIRIKDPGGCTADARALTRADIEIVSGGAGYAVLGRKQPEVTAALRVLEGDEEFCADPTIKLTIAEGSDAGRPFWYVESASGLETGCQYGGFAVYPFTTFEAGTVVYSMPRYINRNCVYNPGYFIPDDAPNLWGATLVNKGYFFLPDPTSVIVADIEVSVAVRSPGVGSGVIITPVVDQDSGSETFGQIIDVEVEGGSNYLAWMWNFPCDCGSRTVVLPQTSSNICLYRDCFCVGEPSPPLVSITFEACHGTGAAAHASEPVGIPGWEEGPVATIEMDAGGSGYAILGRVKPTVDGFSGGGGAGAVITAELASSTGQCGHPVWVVEAVTVTDGGTDYSDGDTVVLTTSDGTVEAECTGRITASAGSIESIEILEPGRYYRDDASQPALEASIAVNVSQTYPSSGSGAKLSAVVDLDTTSETFGQITAVTVDDGGDDYLAASTLTDNCYEVNYPGPPVDGVQPPPSVRVIRGGCDFTRYGDGTKFVAKCDNFTFTIEADDPCDEESRMKVTPGGKLAKYAQGSPCCGCCCDADQPQVNPELGLSKCTADGGRFYQNNNCAAVDCETDGTCCVVIEGVPSEVTLTASDCDDIGGKTIAPTEPAAHGCEQCDCTIDCDYDFTECESYSSFGIGNMAGIGGSTECQSLMIDAPGGPIAADAIIRVGWFTQGFYSYQMPEWQDGAFGEIQGASKHLIFVRNETRHDFSADCLRRFVGINGQLRYVYTDCVTGQLHIHDMSDFWTLHEARQNGTVHYPGFETSMGFIPYSCGFEDSDHDPTGNAPCTVTLACAP